MADYSCATRTNYFRVKDVERFKALINKTFSSDNGVEIFTRVDSQTGETLYGFGCYSSIDGIISEEELEEYDDWAEPDFDKFVDELQKVVADDDAIIIMETGHEKLRYVTGYVTVITSNEVKYVEELTNIGINVAKDMLKNSEWRTLCMY